MTRLPTPLVAACTLLLVAACSGDDGPTRIDDAGQQGPTRCLAECSSPADCTTAETDEEDWTCTDGLCHPDACSADADCPPRGPTSPGCRPGRCAVERVCVEIGDDTYCARKPADDGCFIGTRRDAPRADGEGSAEVCYADQVCRAGQCQTERYSCENDNVECTDGDRCNPDGRCTCNPGDCDDGYTCATP